MKHILVFCSLFLVSCFSQPQERLVTLPGSHAYPAYDVILEVKQLTVDEISVSLIFSNAQFSGAVGIDPLKVSPGHWAMQFVAPQELWITDGFGKIQLMERTRPNGYKNSSSTIVPDLLTRAPENLKKWMQAHTMPEQVAQ